MRIISLGKLFTFCSLYKLLFTSWLFIVVSGANKNFEVVQNWLQTTLKHCKTRWNPKPLCCLFTKLTWAVHPCLAWFWRNCTMRAMHSHSFFWSKERRPLYTIAEAGKANLLKSSDFQYPRCISIPFWMRQHLNSGLQEKFQLLISCGPVHFIFLILFRVLTCNLHKVEVNNMHFINDKTSIVQRATQVIQPM